MVRAWVALAIVLSGCLSAVPGPQCDRGTTPEQRELSCNAAVDGALAKVADRHAAIGRIQFLYGCARPCGSVLRQGNLGPPPTGYVVLTYGDGSAEYIAVTLTDTGVDVAEPVDY